MKTKVENAMWNAGKRTVMIVAASVIMAVNLKTFVRTGGLIPGGFNGLTRLLQEISDMLWGVEPPFTAINLTLNTIPIVISFKFIGKKFTGYSCLMIVLTGLITDLIPSYTFTDDILLVAVFGGLFNALAIAICLMANATSGGTDFIAIFLSEKYDIDSWNYIFAVNVVILVIAGALFGWEKALYSIIFQFTSTQVLHTLHRRYQKQTLLIITQKPEEVYMAIKETTNHDATLFKGEGCYLKQECNMLYSVVGRDEVRKVLNRVRETDPSAFVNMIRTESLFGRFYQRPND
ncbi:MAG: YitT family protein [Lachnospiraceae bacterium]|nr:YitT family protein [uncultured Acetatifactor sp.]MCI8287784.1 YitT family protein [Lachnospiraceae bacterium]